MEKHPPLPMTPFDILVTSSELQMMKLLLPYIPDFYQRFLAFFIKFSELQNTIRYFNPSGRGHSKDSFRKETSSPIDILEDRDTRFHPFCHEHNEYDAKYGYARFLSNG